MKLFLKKYFPKQYEREKIAAMTPKQLGQYFARKSLSKVKFKLNVQPTTKDHKSKIR